MAAAQRLQKRGIEKRKLADAFCVKGRQRAKENKKTPTFSSDGVFLSSKDGGKCSFETMRVEVHASTGRNRAFDREKPDHSGFLEI
jgi:hypothetical protein